MAMSAIKPPITLRSACMEVPQTLLLVAKQACKLYVHFLHSEVLDLCAITTAGRYVFSYCTPRSNEFLYHTALLGSEPSERLMHSEHVPLSMLCMLAALSAVLGAVLLFIHP